MGQERLYTPWAPNVGFAPIADASLRCDERRVGARTGPGRTGPTKMWLKTKNPKAPGALGLKEPRFASAVQTSCGGS